MKLNTLWTEHRRVVVLLFVISCVTTFLMHNSIIAFAFAGDYDTGGSVLSSSDISELSGAFAPLVGVSGSPFIALTVLSGAGALLNSGVVDSAGIPFSEALRQLPIAQTGIFMGLLVITMVKFLTSLSAATKVFSDATLGKIENYVGTALIVGVGFLLSTSTTAYASDVAARSTANISIGAYLLTNVISFFTAVFAYAVYIVMKTMVAAIDILTFLTSPIPGTTAIFTIAKHVVISGYTMYTLANPFVASIIGLVCLIIALFVFSAARRLELYYRKVYLIPFTNALFRRGFVAPLVPQRMPYGLIKEFSNVEICIEGFFMNKVSTLYKRELCYFVRSEGVNYIFKKRLLGKVIKFEISGETYIEKNFRFVKIFTDEGLPEDLRKASLVLRREHDKNIAAIIEKAGLIDYNAILEERRRKKAEELASKAQRVKVQAAEKLSTTGKKIQNNLGGLFRKRSENK